MGGFWKGRVITILDVMNICYELIWIVIILSKIMIWYIMENLSINMWYVISRAEIRSSLCCISAWCMYMLFGWQIQRHRMNKLAWCCSLLTIPLFICGSVGWWRQFWSNMSLAFLEFWLGWFNLSCIWHPAKFRRPYTFCHRRSRSPIKARTGQWGCGKIETYHWIKWWKSPQIHISMDSKS